MKSGNLNDFFTLVFALVLLVIAQPTTAQEKTSDSIPSFWSKVRLGGNVSAVFQNNRTSIIVAPAALYDWNTKWSTGLGINFGYNGGNDFEDYSYGLQLITLYNPMPELQLSAEFEEIGVSRVIRATPNDFRESYWYPALFLGFGYQTRGITIGLRYDVLYDSGTSIHAQAYSPFVRVFF